MSDNNRETNSESRTSQLDLARAAIAEQMPQLKEDLSTLVSFESVHSTPGLEEANAAAAQWVIDAFTTVGIPVTGLSLIHI